MRDRKKAGSPRSNIRPSSRVPPSWAYPALVARAASDMRVPSCEAANGAKCTALACVSSSL